MKQYICKYCGQAVMKDYDYPSINTLPYLVDHLILKHNSKMEEIGSIYLSDIPKRCYKIKEVSRIGSNAVNRT